MEFDDLDDPFQAPPSKPSRFAPKPSKFQPKTKHATTKPPEPKVEPPVTVKKEEDLHSVSADKMDTTDVECSANNGSNVELKEEEDVEFTEASNVEDIEQDYVVAEYDVYYIPPDTQSDLYLLQFPLRPSWRPYELDQRCTEVRVKPNSGEVEIDLSIDTDSDNYNAAAPYLMTKQTLASSRRVPPAAAYAVGVLSGKKLYVNPIHTTVQLRPSMDHLDSGGSKKKDSSVKEVGSNNDAVGGPPRKQSKQMDPEAMESWISVKYHSQATELSERYMKKMMTDWKDPLQFSMNPNDYLNSLCGAAINKMKSRGPMPRDLLSLPLEERIKRQLVEGPSVQRFCAIKHIAPDVPDEDILEVLQRIAHLVQGLWVPKTSLRHPNAQGAELLARHYALLLFSKSPLIKDSELDVLGSQKSTGRVVLREIAIERSYCKDWKLKEPTDVSFMKRHPNVVEQQKKLWQANEQIISQQFAKRKAPPTSNISTRTGPSARSDEGPLKVTNVAHSVSTSMSKETREALPMVLKKLFQTHKVCRFQTICRGLREMAVQMSKTKPDSRAFSAVLAAAKAIDAPQEELQAAICEFAVNVHGVYVLKSSSEHPELNPLRNVVIDLFLGSGPNAKLKKGDFIEAAKIKLRKEPANSEFQKVINEICIFKGGAWVLKSGDGPDGVPI